MNRCMLLACVLYIPHRDPAPKPVLNDDGSVDEAQTFTPAMFASVIRLLTPAQRAFYMSPIKRRANVRGRRIG